MLRAISLRVQNQTESTHSCHSKTYKEKFYAPSADAKGLIAKITNICYKHELNIVQNNEFVDHLTGRFFMRTELEGIFNDTTLLADLDGALPEGSERELHSAGRRRIVVLVTKKPTAWAIC